MFFRSYVNPNRSTVKLTTASISSLASPTGRQIRLCACPYFDSGDEINSFVEFGLNENVRLAVRFVAIDDTANVERSV